ncbi:MAG: hypoxanthine phosphoribosyltransferase, partial [Desulfobacteraceae bacterium]|nr:hypoxanthine phosphoribosyltransferase [Desulfobacteraceae bacterium]
MAELIPVLNEDKIEKLVADVAKKISDDYKDSELVLIGVLKGAFVFMSDLMRRITIPVKIDFVGISSYGSNTVSSGKIRLTREIEIDIKNKDVLIVEDIVDTGLTLKYLIDYLKSFDPKSVKICALLDKHERRKTEINIDYPCHRIEKGFIVGYGIDYAEDYRNLPAIYHLK